MAETVPPKNLEEKIDALQEYLNKVDQERKNERILSKLDGFYNVLISVSTFSIGLIVSQRAYFSNGISSIILFLLISIVLSMIVSFIKGINGMIKNILIHRVMSWGLLISAFISFLAGIVYTITSSVLTRLNLVVDPYLTLGFYAFLVLNILLISPILMRRFGRRLAYLAGVETWKYRDINKEELEVLRDKVKSGEVDKTVFNYVVNTAIEQHGSFNLKLSHATTDIVYFNVAINFAAFIIMGLAYFLGFIPISIS